jgi:hypothetical protein
MQDRSSQFSSEKIMLVLAKAKDLGFIVINHNDGGDYLQAKYLGKGGVTVYVLQLQ